MLYQKIHITVWMTARQSQSTIIISYTTRRIFTTIFHGGVASMKGKPSTGANQQTSQHRACGAPCMAVGHCAYGTAAVVAAGTDQSIII